MRNDAARPGPGRPPIPDAERRRRLLDAAATMFLQHGYAATTTGAIAHEAGMSKKTLYQLFPSKLALFDSLLEDRIFQVDVTADLCGGTQEERLTQLLLAIASVLLQADRIGLMRLIISDGRASPELVSAFERLCMGSKLNALDLWLDREQQAGALRLGDAREAAKLLFGMTVAGPILHALLDAPTPPDEPPLEKRIRWAAGIFLRGLQ